MIGESYYLSTESEFDPYYDLFFNQRSPYYWER